MVGGLALGGLPSKAPGGAVAKSPGLAVADLPKFASGGVTVLVSQVEDTA